MKVINEDGAFVTTKSGSQIDLLHNYPANAETVVPV
jgi:hypothetical protein